MKRALSICVVLVGCHHDAAKPVAPPPAPAPSCDTLSEHVEVLFVRKGHYTTKALEAIAKAVLERCTKDGWSGAARGCIVNSQALEAGHHCLDQLPPEQHATLIADIDAAAHPPAPNSDDASDAGLPAACVEYHRLMKAYFECDKIPQAARDVAKKAFDDAWVQWKDMPEEGKRSLEGACRAAADGAQSMVCPT